MNATLYDVATLVLPLVFAIVFHEVAHGWAARALGDPTAWERRRLSLNPLRHVDPVGTILLPGALRLMGLPVFGWAKPVPVNYNRLNNPKRDMAIVGAAGPVTNFVLALLSAVALGLLVRVADGQAQPALWTRFVADNLQNFIMINAFLGMFNLIPLPPFDGSRILRGLLPMGAARVMDRIEPYGILLFMGIFLVLPYLVPGLHLVDRIVLPPVQWLVEQYQNVASWAAGPEPM
ncbi:site-2 protease family protein [Novosphingobium percolationis]|uniref:site-2 protease family protein n=1 Tax=Novosphingobium percolationis TaxID=2871811 RepID=UPI001CD2D4F1|nr:site-2 protease family protein [Novosphingobium percolationis]